MLPLYLAEEDIRRDSGYSPAIEHAGEGLVVLTLGITRIVEQEGLDVSIYGSADGVNWSVKPLLTIPTKHYCGTYTFFLDLGSRPEVRYLRAGWRMHRWGTGGRPLFSFYLTASKARAAVEVAGVA